MGKSGVARTTYIRNRKYLYKITSLIIFNLLNNWSPNQESMRLLPQLLLLLIISFFAFAQKNIKLSSPDRNIQYDFRLKNKIPLYSVSFKNKPIISDAGMSLSF